MKEHFHNRILYLKDDIYFLQIDGTVEVDGSSTVVKS